MRDKKVLIQAIVDRMKEVLGVSKDVELAEAIGVSRSQVAVWKIRERLPLAECLAIAEQKGISLDWLVLGRGLPGIDEPELALHPEVEASSSENHVEVRAFDMATFLEGDARLTLRFPIGWLEGQGVSIDDTIAMRNGGDAMSPTICDGDVLLIDRRPRDTDGVYVVRVGESMRIRRVQRMHGGALHLHCDNPHYATDVIEADHADDIEIIGYCVAHVCRVR